MAERVSFKTLDEVTIVGDWVTAPTTVGAVILLHTLQQNRLSWAPFQAVLARAGLASLAIDFRGHGESVEGPDGMRLDFKNFTDDEQGTMVYDVMGAFEWINRRGIDPERITLVGASIGANIAVRMLAEESRIRAAVLLSPGDYHGVNVVTDIGAVLPHQSLWMSASEGDDQASFERTTEAYQAASSELKTFEPLKNAGHGTNIFTARPDLMDVACKFLKSATQGV